MNYVERANRLILERQQLSIRLNEINGALAELDSLVQELNEKASKIIEKPTPSEEPEPASTEA